MLHFLTEAQKQERVDYCLAMLKKFDDGQIKNVSMTLSMVMKAGFTIAIWRRSVKVKFGLQEIIHSQAKFVDNFLSVTDMLIIFFIKSGFHAIIPLENGKTVTAKWYTEECLSNVAKQMKEKHERLNDLIYSL